MFLIPTLFLNLIPLVDLFRRDYHFHFQGLGISGWRIWFLHGGIGLWFEVGFFLCGLGVGLVVVPSCGSWVGSFGGLRVEA